MPRYFIDFQDGEEFHEDTEGGEVGSFDQARFEAVSLLPQVAKHELPDGEHRVFISTIRDESGKIIYRATLTFKGELLN